MKKYTKDSFIKKAKEVHENRYDYSKTEYNGARTPVTVTCREHGDFYPTPDNHVNKKKGCSKCAGVARLTLEEYINKASEVHNNKYTYDKVIYTNAHSLIEVDCPTHGTFSTEANSHIKGAGCKQCAIDALKGTEEAFWEMVKANQDTTNYDYSLTEYTAMSHPIIIGCPTHGLFSQVAGIHARGSKCPKCNTSGFSMTEPGTLYYLNIIGTSCYKIGITSLSVDKRFTKEDLAKIRVVKTWNFPTGADARLFESQILRANKEFKYTGAPLLKDGNTELFIKDVLGLDLAP
jgi:hypothetical protein